MSAVERSSAVLDKIKKLLALSTSPNVEEARTAAALAAKLILAHKIELTYFAPVQPQQRTGDSLARPIRITSKYDGHCRTCRSDYYVGDAVLWMPGKGAAHVACGWSP